MKNLMIISLIFLVFILSSLSVFADFVKDDVKISDGLAGFYPDGLNGSDNFGWSVANIGDLDGDGVVDLAVGAYRDENSERSEGALYILFMNQNGSVESNVKISDGLGGFNPDGLDGSDFFGYSVGNMGDLDGDGVQDLAVGAYYDENAQSGEGALYILTLGDPTVIPFNMIIHSPEDDSVYPKKRVRVNIELNREARFITYRDNYGRPKILCRNCDFYDGVKTFSWGKHKVVFKAKDEEGNVIRETVKFSVSKKALMDSPGATLLN